MATKLDLAGSEDQLSYHVEDRALDSVAPQRGRAQSEPLVRRWGSPRAQAQCVG
jgi:hypothetical protein